MNLIELINNKLQANSHENIGSMIWNRIQHSHSISAQNIMHFQVQKDVDESNAWHMKIWALHNPHPQTNITPQFQVL